MRVGRATYAVKLHCAQIEARGVGEATFDIKLQGETVAEKVDVIREAGAASSCGRSTTSQSKRI
ncbi:MAG: malectin domain-containing carbohydrate-binding protein [Planctomycetota bacterium]|nr:malectin domain-containing carbohydrate-binding protein [Planctomycetota bacterium]